MDIFFNELSQGVCSRLTAKEVVEEFIQILKSIRTINIDQQVKYFWGTSDFNNIEADFLSNNSAIKICNELDYENRAAFVHFLSRSVSLNVKASEAYREQKSGRDTEAFHPYVSSVATNRSALSLPSAEIWKANDLTHLPTAGGAAITLPHFALLTFTTIQTALSATLPLLTIARPERPHDTDPLPNKTISDFLLNEASIKRLFSIAKRGNANERKAAYSQIGAAVALLNNYEYSQKISDLNKTKNKLREIYWNSKNKIYLSIDFEKGAFEVLNKNGKHQGEINFTGESTQGYDGTGAHDIKLK